MRYLFFYPFLLFSSIVSSQRLVSADAIFTNTAVVVRFTLAAGTSCSAYSILYCTDSVNYQSVFDGGPCTAYSEPSQFSYAYTSFAPNVINYYKVRLDAWEDSPVLRVYPSKAGRKGLTMYPNPLGPNDVLLNLRAMGTDTTTLYGFLYNRFGSAQRELYLETRAGQAQLNVGDLPQGVYVLWLTDGNNVYSGKFIVIE
jgi:hypothetical protein